jgi:3D (Asp-Asp-Asp) domain-containing protein
VRRGATRWGPVGVAVLAGATVAGIALAGGVGAARGGTTGLQGPSGYRLKVDAVAYHLPGRTASGLPVGKGVVAVDPKVIPLGTEMYVPGYGKCIAADVGTAIKGRIIDLWMPNHAAARKWGRRTLTITVFR